MGQTLGSPHSRSGTLWEDRFRSVIVEDGVAVRTMAAYIEFVDEAFINARARFGPRRRDGARKLKGESAAAGVTLWSLRDLRKGIATT